MNEERLKELEHYLIQKTIDYDGSEIPDAAVPLNGITAGHVRNACLAIRDLIAAVRENAGLREAAQSLLDATIEDCGDPDNFPGDDGNVSVITLGEKEEPSAVTFKLIGDLKAALNATAEPSEDPTDALRASNATLREALESVLKDIMDYETTNNLSPNPGKDYCWQSVERAYKVLASTPTDAFARLRKSVLEKAVKAVKPLIECRRRDEHNATMYDREYKEMLRGEIRALEEAIDAIRKLGGEE